MFVAMNSQGSGEEPDWLVAAITGWLGREANTRGAPLRLQLKIFASFSLCTYGQGIAYYVNHNAKSTTWTHPRFGQDPASMAATRTETTPSRATPPSSMAVSLRKLRGRSRREALVPEATV